jgi:hypothetical protein
MKHLTEEELISYHYADDRTPATAVEHLASCESCRRQYQSLQRLLRVVDISVPERDEHYGAEVWRAIAPQLGKQRTSPWARAVTALRGWQIPRALLIPAAGALVIAAFLAGMFWSRHGVERSAVVAEAHRAISPEARERILLKEIGEHLERSQLALVELVNNQTNGAIDISGEQALARQLLEVNRLYRQMASNIGEGSMASVLDDLERSLVEIAYSSPILSPEEFAEFQERFQGDDLLFKVRILTARLREREQEQARQLAGTETIYEIQ